MRKLFVSAVLVASMVVLLFGGLVSCAPAEAPEREVYKLKLQSIYTDDPTNASVTIVKDYASLVSQLTEGRVLIQVFWGSSLAPLAESLDACAEGVIDILHVSPAHYSSKVPLGDVATCPLTWDDYDHYRRWWDTPETREIFSSGYEEFGVKNIGIFPSPAGGSTIYTVEGHKIEKLEDLAGLKIRTYGGATDKIIELVGAVAVYMGITEIEMALERGTVEGYFTAESVVVPLGLQRVTAYAVEPRPIRFSGMAMWINLELYESMPEDIQRILTDAMDQMTDRYIPAYHKYQDWAVGQCEEGGTAHQASKK